jgi:hypothetical protein
MCLMLQNGISSASTLQHYMQEASTAASLHDFTAEQNKVTKSAASIYDILLAVGELQHQTY